MKLSIITINYNNAVGLEKTINSIVNQSFSDFEYIVIDGASTDGSADIIEKYSEKIDYWVSEVDKGIYNAMNKGIRQAHGEYLLFINSGDTLYENDVLSKVFAYNLKTDLIYGNLHRTFPDGHADIVEMPKSIDIDYIRYSTLTHPTTFIKRELFDKFGLYREDLKIVSDWAFFLRIIVFSNISREHIPLIISSFSMDGISSDNQDLVKSERKQVIEESFSFELLEKLGLYPTYKKCYDNKILASFRKIKRLLINIVSLRSWVEFIHKKRWHRLIRIINKSVRKQSKNPELIPIIIINYNRLSDLKNLLSFLKERKHQNIVIIDNKSTYQPLLDYYKTLDKDITIEYMQENYGHLVFWKNSYLYRKYAKGYYIVTDSDILPNKKMPVNYINYLRTILDQNKKVSKVGLALQIDDIPDSYMLKNKVLNWEKVHWENPISEHLYMTEIDTTFAIYPPYYRYAHITQFYPAIRVAGDFVAKHMGWYVDINNLSAEEKYYIKSSNQSNSWKINEQGKFEGSSYY